MRTAGDQAGEVRHVHQQPRPDFIGDLAEGGEVPMAGIGGSAGNNQLGLVLARQPLDFVEIDQMVVGPDTVLDRIEPFARLGGRGAMGASMALYDALVALERESRLPVRCVLYFDGELPEGQALLQPPPPPPLPPPARPTRKYRRSAIRRATPRRRWSSKATMARRQEASIRSTFPRRAATAISR